MANGFDYTRLKRLITIYYVVQGFLLVLLGGVAFWFQTHVPQQVFMATLIRVVVAQLVLFYPVYKFAAYEALRETSSCNTALSADETMALRRKRVTGDIVKASVFIFFLFFILRAPQIPGAQFTILFVFILSMLCYFQCYNYATKRLMKANP